MANDIKNWLYGWTGRKKLGTPVYNITRTSQTEAEFSCEVVVAGFPHHGFGKANSKKEAASKAAHDFVSIIVAHKLIDLSELSAKTASLLNATRGENVSEAMDWEYEKTIEKVNQNGKATVNCTIPMRIKTNKKQVAQSKTNGGWNVRNSKKCLNDFLDKMKEPPIVYKTSKVVDHDSSVFVAEGAIFLTQLQLKFVANGQANNKRLAESYCALSILDQLFENNLIGAYNKLQKINAKNLNSIEVRISDELSRRVSEYLTKSGIAEFPDLNNASPTEPVSLLYLQQADQLSAVKPTTKNVIEWSPPLPNWNPWKPSSIGDAPLASMSLEAISAQLFEEETKRYSSQSTDKQREALPVFSYRGIILKTVAQNTVTLIKSETGCGKSTQVCQYLLEHFLLSCQGANFAAIVTQPRRISAITLAERVAEERDEALGNSIGYGVRFNTVAPRPYGSIMFMTVGIFLKKLQSGLRGISHVIIDEVHERDINTDFALVVLRDMARQYPEMRLILMSATIDTNLFAKYFDNCPIIQIQGCSFPVEHFFLEDIVQMIGFIPPGVDEERKLKKLILPENGLIERVENMDLSGSGEYSERTQLPISNVSESGISLDLIEAILKEIERRAERGAVLIFLPGWGDIIETMRFLMKHPIFGDADRFVIRLLHSQISPKEQRLVFERISDCKRKIVLSTNIAETSITINDVVYVIDSCKAKMTVKSYDRMIKFVTVWASKTNLQQRKGRAGRVRNGFCYHLCSKSTYEAMQEYQQAEILRISLESIALLVKLLQLGAIDEFLAKAIEPPPVEAVAEAELLLREISALDSNNQLTELGRILACLPIDPILGKTLIFAAALGLGEPMSTLVAASSFDLSFISEDHFDPRITEQQRAFSGTRFSDHVALLFTFNGWMEASANGIESEIEFCKRNSLKRATLISIRKAKHQLIDVLVNGCHFPGLLFTRLAVSNIEPDSNVDLLISLLVYGLYPNVCYLRHKRKVYTLELAAALISKQSVNVFSDSESAHSFPSPLFIFSNKFQTMVITCKHLSNITPLQLLLFGSRRVECYGSELVKLDDMIPLKMDAQVAARILALRPCIEAFIMRSCVHPEGTGLMSDQDRGLLEILKALSSPDGWMAEKLTDVQVTDCNEEGVMEVMVGQYCNEAVAGSDNNNAVRTEPAEGTAHLSDNPNFYDELSNADEYFTGDYDSEAIEMGDSRTDSIGNGHRLEESE